MFIQWCSCLFISLCHVCASLPSHQFKTNHPNRGCVQPENSKSGTKICKWCKVLGSVWRIYISQFVLFSGILLKHLMKSITLQYSVHINAALYFPIGCVNNKYNIEIQPRALKLTWPCLEDKYFPESLLTLKVLNFWKFTGYCSLKPLWLGMGEVVPDRTSPTLHPPSPSTVHQLSWLAL